MKGVNDMSKKKKFKNMANGFKPFAQGMMPMMPVIPVMPIMPMSSWGWNGEKKNKDEDNEWADDFKSNMNTYWEQMIDMQKTSMKTAKDQWNQFFEHMMDMEDTFVDSLPDDAPSIPGLSWFSMSPKELMKWIKQFQEMSNEHFVEQADSIVDYKLKKKEQLYDMVNAAMEKAEEEKKEAAADDNTEEAPADDKDKDASAKTTAAKEAPAKTTAAKEKAAK
jgi:hypothetical protein